MHAAPRAYRYMMGTLRLICPQPEAAARKALCNRQKL